MQAIHDYLNTLSSDPEEEITKMFHVATVANELQTVRNPAWIFKRERECLAQLGDILGRCAEKLVCLALQDARRRALMLSEAATPENKYQWAYFIGALTPTLDHTEIETKVRHSCTRIFISFPACIVSTTHYLSLLGSGLGLQWGHRDRGKHGDGKGSSAGNVQIIIFYVIIFKLVIKMGIIVAPTRRVTCS